MLPAGGQQRNYFYARGRDITRNHLKGIRFFFIEQLNPCLNNREYCTHLLYIYIIHIFEHKIAL